MSEIVIRPATADDLDHVVAGNLAMAAETEGRQLDHETMRSGVWRVLNDPARGVYYLAELNGRAVGQLLITYEWSDWRDGVFWWIQSVYVVPDARRHGVYRALHAWIEQKAHATPDVRGLRLYVDERNTGAQRAYERLGMSPATYRMYETDWSARATGGLPTSAAAPTQVHDVDLYCLNCGYNLRGLSGDPVRCPECFFMNPVGDVQIPAPIISQQLRRMETAPAICVGAFAVGSFSAVALLALLLVAGGGTLELLCPGIPGGVAIVTWIVAMSEFRRSCLAKPGWEAVLFKYHLYGLSLVVLVMGVFLGMAQLMDFLTGRYYSSGGYALFGLGMVLTCALVIIGIRFGLKPIHRRAKATMEQLQREVAVTLARQRSRRKLVRGRRKGLFG